MNSLKVKKTIFCETCGCGMIKTKTIKVESNTKEDAIKEAEEKTKKWVMSIRDTHCKICKSILAAV